PFHELRRRPVWGDVRGEGQSATRADVAHCEEGVSVDLGQDRRIRLGDELLVAEQDRPGLLETADDRVLDTGESTGDALGRLDAVAAAVDVAGEDVLERGAGAVPLGPEALEGEVSPCHHQAAAVLPPVAQKMQSVRGGSPEVEHLWREQQSVRT